MSTVNLKAGISFKLNNSIYTIQKRLPNLRVEALDVQFNETKIFSNQELITYLSSGELKFEVFGKNTVSTNEVLRTQYEFEDIENIKHKEKAIFKFEVIKPLLDIPYSKRNHNFIEKRVAEVNSWANNPKLASDNLNDCAYYKTISKSSVYRWLKEYEYSNGDFRSLIPGFHNCGGKNKSRIDKKVQEFINDSINELYLNKQRVTVKELRSEVIYRINEYNKFSIDKLQIPQTSTFYRMVNKIPEFELVASRFGAKRAENQFSPVGSGVTVSYPLERVEIDHTPVDVILVNESGDYIGRPYLILAVDKFTKHALGFSIGLSNGVGWTEVMECIRHIITDKSYIKDMYPFIENEWNAFGVPQNIMVDNGLEFKNNAMKDACYQLGIVLQYAPPRLPKWKGSIERLFGTSNTGLFHTLPGTTRSNPTKLSEDENPTKSACLTFSFFLALVHKWIVDVYSQDLNKGAEGIPSKLWESAIQVHPVSWPTNTSELSILLGKTVTRKITRRGIELNSLSYNSTDLNKLFIKFSAENNGKNERFKIKYDPNNIGQIHVYDHLIDKKWIKVLCTNQDYADNLTEWEHNEIKNYRRKEFGRVDETSLSEAKKMIRTMIDNKVGYTEKQKSKANKINSSYEINSFLNKQVKPSTSNNNISEENTNRYLSNSSDIGNEIDITDIIIPTSDVIKAESSCNEAVVSIESQKQGKKKVTKTNKTIGPSQKKTYEKNAEIINFAELSGFEIISDFYRGND